MTKAPRRPIEAAELRRRARERLGKREKNGETRKSDANAQRLIHELEVHQIELEMQNEELRAAYEEIQSGLARYTDLYDFAPVVYLTLSRDGTIAESNLAAARLLGVPREHLIGVRFNSFVSVADRPKFANLFAQVLSAKVGKTTEISIAGDTKTERIIDITLSPRQFGDDWQVAVVALDITLRKAQEAVIAKLTRAMRAASACNASMVHAQTEGDLLNSVCEKVVSIGGYTSAFIGFAQDDQKKSISIAAHYGVEIRNLDSLEFTWAHSIGNRGSVGRAIREGTPQVRTANVHKFSLAEPSDSRAEAKDNMASISLPIKSESGNVLGVLSIGAPANTEFDTDEIALLVELAGDLSYGISTLRAREQRDNASWSLKHALENAVFAIARALEMRDPHAAGHEKAVAAIATAIAEKMGLSPYQQEGVRFAGLILDIGKVGIPAEILSRPRRLSEIERSIVNTHSQVGLDIVKDIPFPWPIGQMIFQHHERMDGSGYPRGLKNGEILLEARILAVADVMAAMTAHRPYRPAMTREMACKELEMGRGTLFDPAVVDAYLETQRATAAAPRAV